MHLLEGHADGDEVLDEKYGHVLVVEMPDEHADDERRDVDDEKIDDLVQELVLSRQRKDAEVRAREDEHRLRREDEVDGDDREDDVVQVELRDDRLLFDEHAEELRRIEYVEVDAADDALDELVLARVRAVVVMRQHQQVDDDRRQRDARLQQVRSEEVRLVQLVDYAVRTETVDGAYFRRKRRRMEKPGDAGERQVAEEMLPARLAHRLPAKAQVPIGDDEGGQVDADDDAVGDHPEARESRVVYDEIVVEDDDLDDERYEADDPTQDVVERLEPCSEQVEFELHRLRDL